MPASQLSSAEELSREKTGAEGAPPSQPERLQSGDCEQEHRALTQQSAFIKARTWAFAHVLL